MSADASDWHTCDRAEQAEAENARLTIERDHWRKVAEQRGQDRADAHEQIARLLERLLLEDPR